MDVLFACTGNICRSPMAEVLLRARLAERAPGVTVGSAGIHFDGRAAERGAIKAVQRLGYDLTPFRSRKLSPELIRSASLVLGMERLHVRTLYELAPDHFSRCFTLIEFVEGAEVFGPRRNEELGSWIERIGRLRSPEDYAGADPASEVPDPMGRAGRVFRAVAGQLDDLIDRLVDLAWPVEELDPRRPAAVAPTALPNAAVPAGAGAPPPPDPSTPPLPGGH